MPGREDFGIVRTRFFLDDRAHAAAAEYIERELAVESTALATVAGHVAMLGAFAARETNDGVLTPFAIAVALMTSPRVGIQVSEALSEAGLLRAKRAGKWYLVGFKGCYEAILGRRSSDAERKREKRRKARSSLETSARHPPDIRAPSGGTSADSGPVRSGPERSVGPPTPYRGQSELRSGGEPEGANERYATAKPDEHLRPRASERLERALDYVVQIGDRHPNAPGNRRQSVALSRRTLFKAGVSDDQIREWLLDYAWVTSEKLARRKDGP